MTVALALWLVLTLATAALAFLAVRRRMSSSLAVFLFVAIAPLGFAAMQQPLGYPDYDSLPPGEWRVLGARIDTDVAIYALLDDGSGEPHLYRLPYSAGEADKLQQALDNTAGGLASGVTVRADDQGDPEFHENPVRGDEPKQAETPLIQGAS